MGHHAANLPDGVRKLSLKRMEDNRGWLMETYRKEWSADTPAVLQWNISFSHPGTLRGFHVHWSHHDILCAISGTLHLGLQDMRPWSSTYELATLVSLNADEPAVIYIPPGVAHGFWFDTETKILYGVTSYWDPDDELACRWDDEKVKVPWPSTSPKTLSEKDVKAGTFDEMQAALLRNLQPPTT